MEEFDLVIRNGTVVTAADTFACDIGIKDGRINTLSDCVAAGAKEIDATGKLVMPGGIDGHVHLSQTLPDGATWADDFTTGSRSAAGGGTTTIISFAHQEMGGSLRDGVNSFHQKAEGNSVIDYAFHTILVDPREEVLQELPSMIEDGYVSYKMFMTYDGHRLTDHQLLDTFTTMRAAGGVPLVHAENHDCIVWLTELLQKRGLNAPKYHATAHHSIGEREASQRAIALSELSDMPIMIVHVSTEQVVEQLRWAQNRGIKIYAETCPQYLFLTAADLDKEGQEGAKCICSPPPREVKDQNEIWRAIKDGIFDVVSSDHAPFNFDGPDGKKRLGENSWFCHIPNGVPGVETRLPLLFSGGVTEGRIDLNTFVAVAATNAAKHYGLYPQKGTIAIGSDADLAIWDPEKEVTISNEILHHSIDYTPYEGVKVKGWPVVTISRGNVVAENGNIAVEPGHGRFVAATPRTKNNAPQMFKPYS